MKRSFIRPEGLVNPDGYTQVVTAQGGKLIFVSGQIAFDARGRLVGRGDLQHQTRQVFHNIGVALQAAGAAFSDILKMTIYVVGLKPADRAIIAQVREEFISPKHPPASTLIGVKSLALKEALIEIEVIAAIATEAVN
jgi:enamine deaminase RidA (YjgF/YER057c/UK114 family)